MKIKKFFARMLGTALSIGALSGCGANNTTIIDQIELENQIKAYLDANLDSYLDKYFDYGDDWGGYEQEPDRTQFSNIKSFTANFAQESLCRNRRASFRRISVIVVEKPQEQTGSMYRGDRKLCRDCYTAYNKLDV